jgi:nucleoid DNA-binding protein
VGSRNPPAINNPKTGEQIDFKPKKLPFFKVGKELRERVSGMQIEYCFSVLKRSW